MHNLHAVIRTYCTFRMGGIMNVIQFKPKAKDLDTIQDDLEPVGSLYNGVTVFRVFDGEYSCYGTYLKLLDLLRG